MVLVDSAVAGVWQVRISDVYHGGGRADQPFALAVRGVNVNDLRSDPIVILSDVTYSSEVPQVGEQIEINVPIMNQVVVLLLILWLMQGFSELVLLEQI